MYEIIDKMYLEEIVFKKISHGFPVVNCPECIEVKVENSEPQGKDKRRELGLIANSDQDHEDRSHYVLDNLHGCHVKSQ